MMLYLSGTEYRECNVTSRPKDDIESSIALIGLSHLPGFETHRVKTITNQILKL